LIPNDDKISSVELGIFIFLAIMGIGILPLPSILSQSVNNDAWVLVLIAGLISILFLYIICKLGERHNNLGFVETLRLLFGKTLGTILAIPVALYAIEIAAIELRLFAEITKIYLLHKTPLEFIILPMILLTVILVRMGIEPIARSFGVFLPIGIFIILLLLIFSIQKSDYSNLQPFFTTPTIKYITGLGATFFAYAGFEITLVIFPALREPKKAFKASAIGLLCAIAVYAIITVQCIAGLGSEELKSLIWPVMALTKSISIPGGFIENVEGFLNSMWVLYSFAALVAFVYFFSVVSADIFKHKKPKHFASLCIPIVYLLALQGDSVAEVFRLSDTIMMYLGTYTMAILPVLMLAFSYLKGKKV